MNARTLAEVSNTLIKKFLAGILVPRALSVIFL
jgi:hypothetical protein